LKKFTIIFLLIVIGCGFKYSYKSNLNLAPISPSEEIGVVIQGEYIWHLFEVIKQDVEKYAGVNLVFKKITNEINFDSEESCITNWEAIHSKYPKMSYVFVVKESPPELEYSERYIDEGEIYFANDRSGSMASSDLLLYITRFSIECEILLFYAKDMRLVAKSCPKFQQEKFAESSYFLPANNILGSIERLFGLLGDAKKEKSDRHPSIKKLDSEEVENYFYQFLLNLRKTD
jgi:hypothetical protein